MSLHSDIESIVKSMGLELYDTVIANEFDETIFRVSVISPEFEDAKRKSVDLDTYVELTHLLSPLLDVTPPVSGEYRLEVGSPGIERKLTTLDHFKKSIGEDVALVYGDKEKLRAKLTAVEGNKLTFENEDEKVTINFNDIKKAKTYFEW
ncbi:ribosome maturation factor [Sulfurimonas paralvinellae]|uniref:Ribosome maturation factor RimP n=1 Tax=Sulfurimonas paralvinellae TaxID=317658 RepID=A0A7M1B6C0_9BACT|nr:ribosome maturation factor [Sulfurimonas paralvinellae]QOP45277.1 ribosome maturation factor [Sulfurimonas paralvinellae]